MNLIPNECIEFDEERKICIAIENGKIYKLNNVSGFKIRKVKVDNCILQKPEDRKCDYLMEIKSVGRVIFIELKGGDLVHALKQLFSSISYLKSEFINYQIDVRIVGSRDVPGFINTPDYLRLFKIVRPTNGLIKRSTNKIYSENI